MGGAGLGGRESGSPCKDAVMFTSGSNQECLPMNRMNSNKHESNLGWVISFNEIQLSKLDYVINPLQ